MRLSRLAMVMVPLLLAGCRSAFVEATVSNRTTALIPLIEVDYPSASFGTENLAPGKDFRYRFKVLGTGALKVIYTDASQHEQTAIGPTLKEGDEGPLAVTFSSAGVQWHYETSRR